MTFAGSKKPLTLCKTKAMSRSLNWYNEKCGDEKMKKAIILCCMVVFAGCESDQGGTQDVMQLVQVNKLETQVRQLESTVEAQKIEIEQLKTARQETDAGHTATSDT
jgi:outer membrane murein-binding lipoprotein Lpp